MGFCIFANAAIAALYAQRQGLQRIGIFDWDVHHGNGTQAAIETCADIAFCSIHQSPGYPHTGQPDERGGFNNVLNVPLAPGSTIAEYQQVLADQVVPFFRSFQPDLLIVSAGYDANEADLLSKIKLQPEDYRLLTEACLTITPKILFGLEGGYDLESLARSVLVTIEACLAGVSD